MSNKNSIFNSFDKVLKQISKSEDEQEKLTKEKYKKLREIDDEYSKKISNNLIEREKLYEVLDKHQDVIHRYSKFSISSISYILPILMKLVDGEDYTFCKNMEYEILYGNKKYSSKFFMFKSKYLDSANENKVLLKYYPYFCIDKVEKKQNSDNEYEFYAYYKNLCFNFLCGAGRVAENFINYLINYKCENNILTLDDKSQLLELLYDYIRAHKIGNEAFDMTKEEFCNMYKKAQEGEQPQVKKLVKKKEDQ